MLFFQLSQLGRLGEISGGSDHLITFSKKLASELHTTDSTFTILQS